MDKVSIRCENEVKYLETIIKNRLRTQNRNGSKAGNLYFYPSVICKILNTYEENANRKNTQRVFDSWLDSFLESVYFELITGKIVPLNMVKKVNLIPINNSSHSLQNPIVCGVSLLKKGGNFPPPIQKIEQKYEVHIVYIEQQQEKTEQVYVGTQGNVVTGISDLTVDHVQPIKETLQKNILDLTCIHGIDEIIRASGYTTKNEICKEIPKYIEINDEIYDMLKDELNLILRETKGLRMIASSVN